MSAKPSAEQIRKAKLDNPKLRERDLATQLGISEAEYVSAWIGLGVSPIRPDFEVLFNRLQSVGEVMALTRNESAVHEKIGVFENFYNGKHAAMMLGENIDTRMFPKHWASGFAVEKQVDGEIRRSLQFFDAHGEAVQKIHARPATDMDAWRSLVDDLLLHTYEAPPEIAPAVPLEVAGVSLEKAETLRERWAAMTDTHQFAVILKQLGIDRLSAVRSAEGEFAWRAANDSVEKMLLQSAEVELPIMCFVGNRGCIQIHSGPVQTIKMMGPWLNVLDPTFNLHMRTDHVAELWAVRKPTDKGHVTSLEAYDAEGNLIVQFFGKRIEGQDERPQWRAIVEGLETLPEGSGRDAA